VPDEYSLKTKLLLARRVLRGSTRPFSARPHLLRMVSRARSKPCWRKCFTESWSLSSSSSRYRRPTMRAADLVVGRAKSRSPSESIFRFVGCFSHQAANASRWAHACLYKPRCSINYEEVPSSSAVFYLTERQVISWRRFVKRFFTNPVEAFMSTKKDANYNDDCPRCDGTGKCSNCHGIGNCPRCGGRGFCPECQDPYGRCRECNGSGECEYCHGKGTY
jgi:hypothetical protein